MKKISFALACVALAVFAFGSAHADSDQSLDYIAPGGVSVQGIGESGTASFDGNYIGGVTFDPNGEIPVSVHVADGSGGPVALTVAQDFDDDLQSGDAGEPRVDVCGTDADLTTSTVPFDPTLPIAVFVADAVGTDCVATSLGGTVTLHTITPPNDGR
jgi:hypothetical protein